MKKLNDEREEIRSETRRRREEMDLLDSKSKANFVLKLLIYILKILIVIFRLPSTAKAKGHRNPVCC